MKTKGKSNGRNLRAVLWVDVHKKKVVACLFRGNRKEIREFGSMTDEILSMWEWLRDNGCEMVAMESTGVYWKPVYNILEEKGISLLVANAQHIKAVPGRKTDVKDAQWIADLARHGLIKASFIPDREQHGHFNRHSGRHYHP